MRSGISGTGNPVLEAVVDLGVAESPQKSRPVAWPIPISPGSGQDPTVPGC